MRTYTITEAAEITGLSRKAVARRVERGSLRSVVRNGRRRIPRSELVRAGLLEDGDGSPRSDPSAPFLPRPVDGAELEVAGGSEDMLSALFREVLDRFERQSQEIAQFRALTVQAESLRLTNELADLRVRIAELERQPEQPGQAPQAQQTAGDLGRRMTELSRQVEELSKREIWLPHQAAAQPAPHAGPRTAARAAPAAPTTRPAAPARRPPRLSRSVRFALEAAFIVGVAAVAWLAELSIPAIAVAMGIAWTLVAVTEWLSSERR
jgi:excisionase family DNA binding protein